MEHKSGMLSEPFQDVRMFMCSVIIDNNMDDEPFGHSCINDVEEADELLMTMPLHALPNDLAREHIESGEQGCGTVPFVVVGHRAGSSWLHRQAALGAIERLNLARRPIGRPHDPVD